MDAKESKPALTDLPIGGSVSMLILAVRSWIGGVLMGLANLVPGISGGTMLLAAGVYPAFIESLSSITRFRFKSRALVVLGCVAAAAGIGILILAGTLKDLVIHNRWSMYSLFIGLTLGGVPVVWRLTDKGARGIGLFFPALLAFLAMCVLAVLQMNGYVGSSEASFVMLLFAGLAGASAMILPGLSGGYLLLLLGQYVPILGAVDEFKEALKNRDVSAAISPALEVLLPVGIGVVVGIVVVGNLLKWLLVRFRTQTLGVLLGLLIGSTVGLYPFQQGVPPQAGDVIKGREVTAKTIDEVDQEDWLQQPFRPTLVQVGSAIGLVALGYAITMGVSMIGKEEE